MGSFIHLTLNGVEVDWSKNGVGRNHYSLFPPNSLSQTEYEYANEGTEVKPAFVTDLRHALFRLRHLGYSLQETRVKFAAALTRWNRTASLPLPFEDLLKVLVSIDFGDLALPKNRQPPWEFRKHLQSRLAEWDSVDARLDDFLVEVDQNIIIRLLAENPANLALPLSWQFQDLLDGGWAVMDDLLDVNRATSQMDQTILYGRMFEHSGAQTAVGFDRWLAQLGIGVSTVYVRQLARGRSRTEVTTLPTAVRHMIHHPENPFNVLQDTAIRESTEQLLAAAGRLPTRLPNLH